MGNDSYLLGSGVGLAYCRCAIILPYLHAVRKKRGVETRYDERQELARGKAYRLGFTVPAALLRGRWAWPTCTSAAAGATFTRR
jgi:hypothetical protein